MKIRLLLITALLLLKFEAYTQKIPALNSLQQFTVVGGTHVEGKESSKIKGGVLPAASRNPEARADLARVYAELQQQPPTATLQGEALSGGQLKPGVYRIKGNAHLRKTLRLLANRHPNASFIFQVEGDLLVNPGVAVELGKGVNARNVFWQVAGKVTLGNQTALKGAVVAAGNITSTNAQVQGNLWSKAGSVSLLKTDITPLADNVSDLEIKHTVTEGPYRVGQVVTYTITLKNLGPEAETNVAVSFDQPGHKYLTSTTSVGSAYDPATGYWTISQLPSGSVAVLVVTASIQRTEFSTTVATVTGDGKDPNIKNNTSELSICATPSKLGEVSGQTSLCVNTPGNVYQVAPVAGTRKYAWTLPEGWTITSGAETNKITVTTGGAEARGRISVRPVNACGEGPESILEVSTVSSPPPMPSTITGPKEICGGKDRITYSIAPVSGAASFQWTVPAGWTIESGQGTTSITVTPGTTGGQVKVTAENGCGKSASSEAQVAVSPSAPQKPTQLSGPEQVCANADRITYRVANDPTATSYTWTVPEGWTILSGQGTATVEVKAGTSAGQVTVKARNGCGTSPEASIRTVVSSGIPAIGAISGSTALCLSQAEQTYSVEPVEGVTSYQWSVPADWRLLSGQGSRRINVKAYSTGEVKLIATNACGESTAVTLKVTVSTAPPSIPGIISGVAAPCFSQENLTYSVKALNGATSYVWSLPTGWTLVSGQGTSSIEVKAGTTAGTISVTASNGCGDSPVKTLLVTPTSELPAATVAITGETAPCAGAQQTYTISQPVAGLTYTWVLPQGWSLVSGQGSATVVVKPGTTGGRLLVTASNACGQSTSTALAVTPSTGAPALAATIQGQAGVCASADQLTYSITSNNAVSSFNWQVPAGWTIVSGQGTREIIVKAGANGGSIQVTATNGCGQNTTRSLPVSISSTIPVAPTQITGPAALCANQGEVTYSIAPVAGATSYTWTIPTGWTLVRGQGTTKLVVRVGSVAEPVRVVAQNACGTSAEAALQVNLSSSAPAKIGPILGDKAFCSSTASRTYAVAEVEGAKTYTWAVPAGWTITSGQGTRTISVTPGTAGGYVKVTAANYCSTSTDSTNITVAQPLSATPTAIQGATAPCISETALTYSVNAVPGATQYTWAVPSGWTIVSGQGTTSIQVTAGPGAGAITVAAANACGASATLRLEVTPAPQPVAPAAITGTTTPCGGGTEQTYQVQNPVAGMAYTWAVPAGWSIVSGQGTGTVVVKVGNTAGNLTVQASTGCGTSAAQTLAIIPISLSAATDPVQGATAFCANTVQTYKVAASTGATTYQWQVPAGWTIISGQGTPEVQVRAGSGTGEVAVTTQYSCGTGPKRVLAVSAGSSDLVAPARITGTSGVCAQANQVTYAIPAVDGATSYAWTVPTGWTITAGQGTTAISVKAGSAAGQVSVTIRNACGASASTTLAVSVAPVTAPVLGAITSQGVTCATTRVTYQVAAVAGVTAYTWSLPAGWDIISGQGTHQVTVAPGTAGGTLSVVAVNACGLSSKPSTLPVQIQTATLARPNPIIATASALKPCIGQSGIVFRIDPVAGATSYQWTLPADWKVEAGQGTTTLTVTAGSTAGTIRVVAKNACGESESQTVAVVPGSSIPVIRGEISGSGFLCANTDPVTYSIGDITGAAQLNWTIPTGWTLVAGQGTTSITVIPSAASGTIKVQATSGCGVSAEKTLQVTPGTVSIVAPSVITGPTAFCETTEQQVYDIAEVAGAESYEWTVPAGWTILKGQGTASLAVVAKAGNGTVSVKATNACGNSAVTNLRVAVAPPLVKELVILDESSACVGNQFSVVSQPGVTYTWTIEAREQGWAITSGQGTNKVTVRAPANAPLASARILVVASNGNCSTASSSLDIAPQYLAPELNVPNVFSPNNDGKNDLWVVRNLLEYPDNDLVILNRWGSEVYRMKQYRNNWNGGGLAEGTYYYVLRVRLCDNQEMTYRGYVTVMR
ncbi:ice-binding family protein [Rufibacter psychrotolerans]|uniref:ice-binding family protein n=1 Tax=Rufibacter psychrotolerans TaxID=2812556 RepID=UPI001F085104|nr:ice-binding family protein [Rufibacter sp. SYSU D00308]